MNLINLTPHAVVLWRADGDPDVLRAALRGSIARALVSLRAARRAGCDSRHLWRDEVLARRAALAAYCPSDRAAIRRVL